MSDRKLIQDYLVNLQRFLSRLNNLEADDVIREIESHIYDSIELAEANGEQVDISAMLERFGSPRQLAEQYTDHILDGAPPPAGFSAIRTVQKGVSQGLYWGTAIFGYLFGFGLLIMAFAKLFMPELVGVWSSANGNSFVIGIIERSQQSGEELLGFWIVPIGFTVGIALMLLTNNLLRVLKRSLIKG